jgi:hypothetical protein
MNTNSYTSGTAEMQKAALLDTANIVRKVLSLD